MKKITIIVFALLTGIPAFAADKKTVEDDKDYFQKQKFNYFFMEAIRLKQKENHSDAFHALQHALLIDSTSSVVLAQLSDYYLFLQEDSLAIDVLKKAVYYNPENFEYKVSLASIYRDFEKNTEAIQLYEELVKDNPDRADLHFFLSDLYLREKQIDKSIKSLDALENNLGMNEALSLQKYKLYMNVEQKENALKELEELALKYPSEAKYPILIGNHYLNENEPDKALSYYREAHQIDPQSPYYQVAMINYYEKTGDEEAANKEIETALNTPTLDMDAKLSILGKYISSIASRDSEKVETATTFFESLMKQHSQEMELNLMYAQFLLSINKIDEAEFQFKAITESNPEELMAWRLLINITSGKENPDRIINLCDSALIHFPDASEFYFYKGLSLSQKKEYKNALAVYLEGVTVVEPEQRNAFSTFYAQIGDSYYQLGQKEEAYNAYDKSLEYNENNIFVLNNYAYFLSLDKVRLEQAERMSSKCIKAEPNNPTYVDTYAWILFQRGNYSLAKLYIEGAISDDKEGSPDIIEHYGDILFKTGNTEKAVQQWEKALELKDKEKDTKILQKKIKNKTYYESEK
ncbi:MAG: tetratricopeptide repeat protein [Dysgonamonadaceae bacterium]|jgi:tetratricopeptide (TPR) repeat protein|nr:tetratricopeptide repeat protein [Dysgonamonadaceae bacterium]